MYAMLLVDNADERAVFSLVLQRAGPGCNHRARPGPGPEELVGASRPTSSPWPSRAIPWPTSVASRAETPVPIILVVDPVAEDLHFALLETGADLVVSRPFSARLLIVQVQALIATANWRRAALRGSCRR